MTDWYCSYCDKIVAGKHVVGAKHKDCGWRAWPMLAATLPPPPAAAKGDVP